MPRLIIFMLVCVVTSIAHGAPTADDATLSRLLIGAWSLEPMAESATTSESSYSEDGSCTEAIWKRDQDKGSGVKVTGRWQIKDGVLQVVAVTTTDSEWIEAGRSFRYEIVTASADKVVAEFYLPYDSERKHPCRITLLRKKEPREPIQRNISTKSVSNFQ